MGVRGLQYFIEECCNLASPVVNIPDIVENARQAPNQELVIVVDGSNCIRQLYGDLEWIGGGQLKQFGEKAKRFVQAFNDIGVKLVFFFDGPTVDRKRRTWVERRMSTMERMYFVLDAITRGTPSDAIPKRYFQLPPGLGQLSRLIFEIICGCEVYQSIAECDEEIAAYAKHHRVFAILAQDSDYIIMDVGDALYLSMERLNLDTMTTRMYDKRQLARRLHIRTSQLPLLATLMGNDIVSHEDLKYFHCSLTGQRNPNQRINFRQLVPNIANFIQSLPYNPEYLNELLPEIAERTLGHPSQARAIQDSLRSYDSVPERDRERGNRGRGNPWLRLVAEARRRHQNNKMPSMVYAIMTGLPFESSTSIEDFRKRDLPTFASATKCIRQRIYGILLQEKRLPPSGEHVVEEWCMAGPGSLDEADYVPAIPPPRRHPGLMELWNDSLRLLNIRWELFVHTVSPNISLQEVRCLPPYLVIPTLILFYINELNCLVPWEVDAMLATATCLKYYNVTRLEQLNSDPIHTRGIRVANLIMRSTFVLYILLAACGYPLSISESAPWLFFDGKLFQYKFNQAQNEESHMRLCDNREDVLEDFMMARQIVFDNYV